MKFVLPFLGKTREKYLDAGIADYVKRLSRFVQVEIVVLKDSSPKNIPDQVFKQQEAERLLDRIKPPAYVVALDTTGREIDSPGLAERIADWENNGLQTVYFLIGGHLGLHEDVLSSADIVLSLSRLTFTHEMSRLILLEQLYRAWTIKAGRKYHN
ncbi:MAG TPA: 23S rRNA (pseudouridine(1915)-N(3))-methyltransferase RlmH [Desulfobacteraceae bacterium]|nr:23S rRNA (pseudouridine(1915)-N(3))-methyltransferase RlmH [Desulfobacteraceae bacterium]